MSILSSWAHALGGEVAGRQVLAPGPGHSPNDRSLSVSQSINAPGGFTVYSHSGDDFRLCRDHVAQRLGIPLFEPRSRASKTSPARRFQPAKQPTDNADVAARLWRHSEPIDGTVAERYLREVRGIRCGLSPTMRYLPRQGKHPDTMVAAFGVPSEPEPATISVEGMDVRAVHRTRLTQDGQKIGKAMLGSPAGLPLVLGPWTDSLGLVIAEGVEDALSAHQVTGLPAWAAGSAAHLPKVADAIPSWTDCVTLLVDDNDAGRAGCHKLAGHLARRGISVELREAVTMIGGCAS